MKASDWGMWVGLVGQLIQAIAKAVGEPVDKVRERLLADPRIVPTMSDAAADQIAGAMPPGFDPDGDCGADGGGGCEPAPGKRDGS